MPDTATTPPIKDLLGSVKALATAHNLLADEGHFKAKHLKQIQMLLPYLKRLYDDSVLAVTSHPEADGHQEVIDLREQIAIERESERLVREAEVEAAAKKVGAL